MTVASQPKAGRRGDITSLALLRDRPFREEHERSTRLASTPQTWAALEAWFRDAWETSLPTRMHTRGVEDGSALGSPAMARAMHARTDHVSEDGWGVTGWDRDGQPRGIDRASGLTRSPFLFYLECRLRSREESDRLGARMVIRWAYMGWDIPALAHAVFLRTHGQDDFATEAMAALLERTVRRLWHDCQREPVRYAVCRECRRMRCVCCERSEAQVNAEEAT